MTSRLKEDERNERTIRNLLKLPENRRCINCNSLGPQYVCTNFWTFVCTTCSGIHREFTHRVKSVSMAKFTSLEVSALQGGGNASAKEIYFKEWDPQRQSLPDSSNVERLRDFIRHVYVDKRYSGENRSPRRGYTERRSDEISSKNSRRDQGMTSPPIVGPVGDILKEKEKVSPLRIIEPPKANGPLPTQRSVSSNRNSVAEVSRESSLIDFDSVPSQQTAHNNWANFDSVQETPSNTNFLDVLSQLSVPVPASLPGGGGSFFPPQSSSPSGPGQYGMGYNTQYNVPVPMPPAYYLQPSYPFYVNESSSLQPIMFPSMAPQSGIQRTSSLGTFSPTQSSTIQRTSSLATPSPFSQLPPPPRQQLGGFGSDNTSFGSFNLNQHQTGGNPFG